MTDRGSKIHIEPLSALPRTCDPRRIGLDPREITRVACLHQRHGHAVYRLECGARSFVLKWFPEPAQAMEVRIYALLAAHGVPTLPVYARTEQALLLEDLATSAVWRLATETDMQQPETGAAVATWYRALHAAGREVLAASEGPPTYLRREGDVLDAHTILDLGKRLGLVGHPVWTLAADCIEPLKAALRSLPETLIYDDFHWTNLALARRRAPDEPVRRAIVYDYHALGIGPAASDYRNVVGALGPRAQAAFRERYGPVDEREVLLDAPIAILYALHLAAARPRLPAWVHPALQRWVHGGELAHHIQRALAIL